PYRYVRVLVKVQSSGDALLANLGHELQHVIEVMGADWVTDARSLLGLYRQIGKPTNSSRLAWDTVEAQWTGEQILRELKGQAAGAASAGER
ncbi:MAG: hypothetical protein OEW19_15715, partial [Acidobacteriota bacterium]|nr:hypothetical protein [Acidobacteriota bacterium]